MRNYLTFGGVDCRDYGVYISGQGVFGAPSRAYDMTPIPGRNGNIVGTEKRLENITVEYPAFVYSDFKNNIKAWRNYLLSCVGYQRLIDTYNPEEYRMGIYAGPFEVEVTDQVNAGKFTMEFDCKPQRFLLSGETVQTFAATGSITNPTRFPSRPLLRVYGVGSITIGGVGITLTSNDYSSNGIYIDCEMMDAYYLLNGVYVNRNAFVTLTENDYPVLPPGQSAVTVGSGITRVEITPRWWCV